MKDLAFSCAAHHDAFIVAYGAEKVKPKHHQQLHLAKQVETDEGVIGCWAQERKMGMARQAVQHSRTMDNFEVGMLARFWTEQMRQLQKPSWARVLQGRVLDCPEMAEALHVPAAQISTSMRWHHSILYNGDICGLPGNRMCLVVGCLRVEPPAFA